MKTIDNKMKERFGIFPFIIPPISIAVCVGALLYSALHRNHPEYDYYGRIGNEYVRFSEDNFPYLIIQRNKLSVSKPNGRVAYYYDDKGDDLKIERFVSIICQNSIEQRGCKEERLEEKSQLKEAQRQFEDYLSKIKEIKRNLQEINCKRKQK